MSNQGWSDKERREMVTNMTSEEFIQRMIDGGWTRREAQDEWNRIQDEPEEDWEGQL